MTITIERTMPNSYEVQADGRRKSLRSLEDLVRWLALELEGDDPYASYEGDARENEKEIDRLNDEIDRLRGIVALAKEAQ